jgi:oxalyl-CoA decarboxylase
LTALANATTNCWPMILISGSSEREIVDLMQGDYEEMDQLAIAKPLCKAAYRVLHAEDIGIAVARAIRSAVTGRPGGVYLDIPGALLGQVMDAVEGQKSLVKVIDPAPRQIPAPDAVARAIEVMKGAKKPLIIMGKGAAYDQSDEAIREFVEKSGYPYLPMSMAKGLLPDVHPQCASAARSLVLKEADVVIMIGARLNWLLSHGKGKQWGEPRPWSAMSAPAWRRLAKLWAIAGRRRPQNGPRLFRQRSKPMSSGWRPTCRTMRFR